MQNFRGPTRTHCWYHVTILLLKSNLGLGPIIFLTFQHLDLLLLTDNLITEHLSNFLPIISLLFLQQQTVWLLVVQSSSAQTVKCLQCRQVDLIIMIVCLAAQWCGVMFEIARVMQGSAQTSASRLNLKFKILTNPSFRNSTKIQLHNFYKTSAAK